jgi:hypothetical protein
MNIREIRPVESLRIYGEGPTIDSKNDKHLCRSITIDLFAHRSVAYLL